MDLNQIRSFLAVTQTLNFTNAARQNGVPQSTISRQISDLESQLGVRLFYRTRRDVQLTQEGRTFLPYALEMMEASQKGAFAVRQLRDGAAGRLSLATIAGGERFLQACLADFGRQYPDIVVDLTYVSGGEALLEEGKDPYDFHFMYEDMLPESEEFDTALTYRDTLCLVGREGDTSLAALPNSRILLLSESESPILYMHAMAFFRSRRFAPNVINEADDVRSVLLGVRAGLGVTILPRTQAEECGGELATVPLDLEIGYGAAWRRSLLNPAARLFLQVLKSHAAG